MLRVLTMTMMTMTMTMTTTTMMIMIQMMTMMMMTKIMMRRIRRKIPFTSTCMYRRNQLKPKKRESYNNDFKEQNGIESTFSKEGHYALTGLLICDLNVCRDGAFFRQLH